MTKISIFLVDDHPVVRNGLKHVLATQPDFIVIGETGEGHEALSQLEQLCPDIVIMDVKLPDLSGIEVTRRIQKVCPNTKVIILTMHSSTSIILDALQAGAKGYLIKGSASNEVNTAIRAVYTGRRYLGKKVVGNLGYEDIDRLEASKLDDPLNSLSAREREVLQLVVEGKTSADIAEKLNLSTKTVETYRYRLMQKLNITDIPTLVKFAIQHDLTSLK